MTINGQGRRSVSCPPTQTHESLFKFISSPRRWRKRLTRRRRSDRRGHVSSLRKGPSDPDLFPGLRSLQPSGPSSFVLKKGPSTHVMKDQSSSVLDETQFNSGSPTSLLHNQSKKPIYVVFTWDILTYFFHITFLYPTECLSIRLDFLVELSLFSVWRSSRTVVFRRNLTV